MAGKSLVSLVALLVEILDMMAEEGGEGEIQVITLVTLNLWVWGFRVEPIPLDGSKVINLRSSSILQG